MSSSETVVDAANSRATSVATQGYFWEIVCDYRARLRTFSISCVTA